MRCGGNASGPPLKLETPEKDDQGRLRAPFYWMRTYVGPICALFEVLLRNTSHIYYARRLASFAYNSIYNNRSLTYYLKIER